MSRLTLPHIRSLVVLLATMLPILGLMVYTQVRAHRQSVAEASAGALGVARIAADEQSRDIQSSRQFLMALAQVPEIGGNDAGACTALLDRLLKEYPLYQTLSVTLTNGNLFCSAPRVPARLDFWSRDSFREALQTRDFVIGNYEIDPLSAQPGLAVANPVEDAAGNLRAILSADISLTPLSQLAGKAELPAGSTSLVIDRQGTVLAYYPDPAKWVGQRLQNAGMVRAILAQPNEGVAEADGVDGVRRWFAWSALPGAPGGAAEDGGYVVVGIPSAAVYASADETLVRSLALLFAATLLSFMIAWEANDHLIVRSLNRLLQATEPLGAGDFSSCLGVPHPLGDWSGVADRFTRMAQSLQARDHDLRAAERKYRTLVEQLPAVTYAWPFRPQAQAYISPQVESILGFPPEQFLATREAWVERIHPEDRARVLAEFEKGVAERSGLQAEYRAVTRDGRVIWVHDRAVVVPDEEGRPLYLHGLLQDITERKQLDQVLRASEERWRLQIEHMPIGCIVRDAEFRFQYWNAAAENIFGYRTEEVSGRYPSELITPLEIQPRVQDILHQVAQGDTTIHGANENVTKDGRVIICEWWNTPLKDHKGQVIGILSMVQDVTDRQRAQEEIAHQAQLLANVSDAIVGIDPEWNITFWNRAAERLDGRSQSQVLGKKITDIIRPAFSESQLKEIILQVTTTGRMTGQLTHQGRGGQPRQIEWNALAMRNPAGQITGYVTVSRDITAYKRAEEEIRQLNAELEQRVVERTARLVDREAELLKANAALQQEEEKLRTLIDSIADEVWFCNAQGKAVLLNAAALLNLGLEDAAPRSLADIFGRLEVLTPDGQPRPLEETPLLHSLRGETVKGEEIMRDYKTGEMRYRHYSSAPTRDHAGRITGAVAVITDMTERKKAEDEIARLNERLEQRALELENANRELDAFAYSVSHDLRTPLASIDSFSRLVAEDYGGQLAPEGQRFMQLIQENAASMTRLIQDLLLFSRATRQPLQKRTVAPAELVEQVLQELRGTTTGRHVETVVGNLPPCEADPILLKQVYANLLSNALKFTLSREVVRIEIGCRTDRREPVYFVKDNGVGFDMDRADKLFGVFQRFHREDEYAGTGVGLAIVERIVHRHGGRVWAEAEEDKGATFYFTLP